MSTHCRPAGRMGVGLLLIAALGLTSCVTGTRLSEEEDRKAKAFSPPPGRANVYIVRRTRMVGGSVHAAVCVRNPRSRSTTKWEMSEVGNGAYCVFTLPAGNHPVYALWGDCRGQRILKLRPGRCYFYEIGLGGFAHVDLDPLGAAAGRELVLDSVGVVVERDIEIPLRVLGIGESERHVGSPVIIPVPSPSLGPRFKVPVRRK